MSGELRRPSVRLFPTDQVSSKRSSKNLEEKIRCRTDRLCDRSTGWLASTCCTVYPDCDWVSNRYGEAMLHSQECRFRPVACPHMACKQAVPENALAEHMEEWHKPITHVQVPDGRISKKVYFQSDVSKSTAWPLALFDFNLRTFIPSLERNPADGLFYAWVTIIGNKKEAQKYR